MASMQLLKTRFKQAADEAIKANYEVWEDMDKKRVSLRAQIAKCVAELEPLKDEITTLNAQINKINSWDIERFIDLVDKLKGHLYGEDRKIIEFFVQNYKKKE
jgi:cell division protein FtsB